MSAENEAQPSLSERRKHPRRAACTPATVRVLVEEETFSPLVFDGVCENASRSGALLTVPGMSGAVYGKLIHRPRYVRVSLGQSEHRQPLTVFGKLIWYDYQNDPERPVCKLAIAFEPMKEETAQALEQYLKSLTGDPA